MNKITKFYDISKAPPKRRFEVALIGRSNVGKSSLINSLINDKSLRVSKSPGCTMWLQFVPFHNIDLVDLPGYGYAKTNESKKHIVNKLVKDYFSSCRADMVFMLIDLRRYFTKIDFSICEFIKEFCPEIRFVGMKSDKKDAKDVELDFKVSNLTGDGIQRLKDYLKTLG